jgi:hypothetical protein
MSEKYVIVTMATIAQENRTEIMKNLPALVDVSRSAGSSRAGMGIMLTGSMPGTALMLQMVDELNKMKKIYSAFSSSETYKSLLAAGDYLLGISYESLAQVEATYDTIAKSPLAAKIYDALDVNARSVTQLLAVK